jgi:hypothetical protein
MMDFERLGRDVVRALGEDRDDEDGGARRRAVLRAAARRAPHRWRRPALGAAVALASVLAGVLALRTLRGPSEAAGELAYWADGVALPIGAELRAEPTTPMPLRFADGSTMELRGGTQARVRRAVRGQVEVALEDGALSAHVHHAEATHWTFVAGQYAITVTGTVLTVNWSRVDRALAVTVDEGSVVVVGPGLGDGRRVNAGAHLAASESAPSDEPAAESAPPPPSRKVPVVKSKATSRGESWQDLAAQGSYAEALDAARAGGLAGILAHGTAADLALLADTARYTRAAPEARTALRGLAKRFPRSDQAQLVPFLLARLAAEIDGKPEEAARLFALYVSHQPHGDLVEEARGRLIEEWQRAGDRARAQAAARDYLEHHPNGPHARLAQSVLQGERAE